MIISCSIFFFFFFLKDEYHWKVFKVSKRSLESNSKVICGKESKREETMSRGE
jgi:hypothetical protein